MVKWEVIRTTEVKDTEENRDLNSTVLCSKEESSSGRKGDEVVHSGKVDKRKKFFKRL